MKTDIQASISPSLALKRTASLLFSLCHWDQSHCQNSPNAIRYPAPSFNDPLQTTDWTGMKYITPKCGHSINSTGLLCTWIVSGGQLLYVISKDIGIPIQQLWNEGHSTPAESEEVTFKKWAVEETVVMGSKQLIYYSKISDKSEDAWHRHWQSHVGWYRCSDLIQKSVYWPILKTDCTDQLTCEVCKRPKNKDRKLHSSLLETSSGDYDSSPNTSTSSPLSKKTQSGRWP